MPDDSERQRNGDDAGATARADHASADERKGLATDALVTEVDRVRADNDFTSRATRLLNCDQEVLDALGE